LQYYFYEKKLINNYYETRNDLFGWEFSSKLSPWLAAGCVSPKKIYEELKNFEKNYGENKSTYWLYFELLWRDYFRLMAKNMVITYLNIPE
jgi:deoxyribodipyrimidine photo-lyase